MGGPGRKDRAVHPRDAMKDRLGRVWLLAQCMAYALVRGTATRVPENPKVILVVLTGKLGDQVCGTPVLRALRARLPSARLIAAGGGPVRALLEDSGLADDYVELEKDDVRSRINACGADAALVLGPSFGATALCYLAGIPLVVAPRVEGGFSPGETKLYKSMRKLVATFPYRMREYAPQERLRALEPLGIVTEDTKKHLGFSQDARDKTAQFFRTHGLDPQKDLIVGISPSAGHKIKEWPAERFAEVADYLIEAHHTRVVLTGSPDERSKTQAVLAHSRNAAAIIDAQGKFSIDEMKALISRISLFISVDTGPIYIAEAFGIPTIDITGPIDENEQPPRGPLHLNVVPPERAKPELFVLNARSYDEAEALRQVYSITVDAAKRAVDLLVQRIKDGEHATRA